MCGRATMERQPHTPDHNFEGSGRRSGQRQSEREREGVMSQRQCPWCGQLGQRVDDAELEESYAQPHADGSSCVCRHVSSATEAAARRDGGRWWDGRWRCAGGCDHR